MLLQVDVMSNVSMQAKTELFTILKSISSEGLKCDKTKHHGLNHS